MNRSEYLEKRGELEDAIESLDSEWLAQFRNEDGTYQTLGTKHFCDIYVRGCQTYRDCYCAATDGKDHDEGDFPLVGSNGKTY